MIMSKHVRKLSLSRETLRLLRESELRQVVGGWQHVPPAERRKFFTGQDTPSHPPPITHQPDGSQAPEGSQAHQQLSPLRGVCG
jgi:hypothetical protein